MSDRIAVMHQGRLQQMGRPQEIYESPQNRFVADFIGVCNFIECRVTRRANATVVVSFEDGALATIAVPAGTTVPAEGERVIATVRPEKIVLKPAQPSLAGALHARLDDPVYVGTAVHYHLRTAAGTRLVAYWQNNSPPPGLLPGTACWCRGKPTLCACCPSSSG
jgi:spermidine/putrescine transport system ATP-binding protein